MRLNRPVPWKILYFILPIVTLLIGNILIYFLLGRFENRALKVTMSASCGIAFFYLLIKLVMWLATRADLVKPYLGNFSRLFFGIIVGVAVSSASGLLYANQNGRNLDWQTFGTQAPYAMTSAIAPALTEEAVFRFGIVHGAAQLGGLFVGVAAGSLPFGFLHLVDRFFGTPVDLQQVLGIVLAGILLSILYLQFGLWAAIGCHYTWNALAGPWAKAMQLDAKTGITQFEGAWSTSIVISAIVAVLILVSLQKPRLCVNAS